MQEMTEKQKRKLQKLAKLFDDGNVAILEHLFELEEMMDEKMPDLDKVLDTVKGKDGETPQKGVHYFDGKDGRTPIFVGNEEPKNPQKGDLWYQD